MTESLFFEKNKTPFSYLRTHSRKIELSDILSITEINIHSNPDLLKYCNTYYDHLILINVVLVICLYQKTSRLF